MTFFCLCMSPAIDALVKLPAAPKGEGEIFKDIADEENVGGKTINVGRWLAIRSRAGSLVPPSAHSLPSPSNSSVVCGGLLGEDNAALFAKELARYGIVDRFLRVAGSTRRNEMVTWPGGSFKVNRAAFPSVPSVRPEDVLAGADGADVAILSGSLPKCCAPSFYADCIRILKAKGIAVVLDASGEALRLGVEAGPDVIKPNAEECEPLVGFVPKTPDDFRRATEILREKIARRNSCPAASEPEAERAKGHDATVIISDGGNGSWFDGEFVPAPKVDVVDTTAAGDTLLAEWCWRRGEGVERVGKVERVVKVEEVEGGVKSSNPTIQQSNNSPAHWAVAAGSAACAMPGSQPPPVELVERLISNRQ